MAQDTDSNIARAVTGDSVIWVPSLQADWLLDGFDGPGTYDDLSGQSSNYRVVHSINDGLPDEVSFLAQSGVPVLTADLSGRDVGGRELTPLQYFSQFQQASPLYGLPRDIAPVTFDQGVVTQDGVQSVRLFTGQMVDTPADSAGAKLQAISQTRLLLSQLVQPPPIGSWNGAYDNGPIGVYPDWLTTTWLASWTLHRCGVYPSPPPASGCFYHMPFHGGGWAFSQFARDDLFEPLTYSGTPPESSVTSFDWARPYPGGGGYYGIDIRREPANSWVPGPYVAGLNAWSNSETTQQAVFWLADFWNDLPVEGAIGHIPFFRRDGSTGRVELYLRGDTVTIPVDEETFRYDAGFSGSNIHPGASGQALFRMSVRRYQNFIYPTDPYLFGWVSATDRKARLEFWNGTTLYQAVSSGSLPSDGKWYHVGFAWSIDTGKLWVTLDGADASSNITLSSTGALMSEGDDYSTIGCASLIPVSEVQMLAGAPAKPTVTPWLPNRTWTRGAYVTHGYTEMRAVSEPTALEAYTLLQELAQVEATTTAIDEHDIYHWRPPGWYATVDGQTETETVTTDRHAQTPDVRADYTRTRNVVRVAYQNVRPAGDVEVFGYRWWPSLVYTEVLAIPPGTTTYRLPTDSVVLRGNISMLAALRLEEISDWASGVFPDPLAGGSFVTINTQSSGGGTFIYNAYDAFSPPDEVTSYISAVRPNEVEITFVNHTATTLYAANGATLADGTPMPTIWIGDFQAGITSDAQQIEYDLASVVLRGPRVLQLQAPRVQSETMAYRLARRVLGRSAWPVAVVDRLEMFGDPRRQPGDLVRISDPDQSGFDAAMRILEIEHTVSGAIYTQTARLQEAPRTGRWGDGVSRWGRIVWASRENPGMG